MTYQGKVKGGSIELEPGVALPEGALVRIELLPREDRGPEGAADPLLEMPALAVDTGISDLATNVGLSSPSNQGVLDGLLACPEKGFFVPIESESTDIL
jgi:hypothetical protein